MPFPYSWFIQEMYSHETFITLGLGFTAALLWIYQTLTRKTMEKEKSRQLQLEEQRQKIIARDEFMEMVGEVYNNIICPSIYLEAQDDMSPSPKLSYSEEKEIKKKVRRE